MQRRSKESLNAKLERNLVNYAIAAGAAGMGLLSIAQPVRAEVVYTPAHVQLGTGVGGFRLLHNLDVNNDGRPDFQILRTTYCHYRGCNVSMYALAFRSHQASIQIGTVKPLNALARKIGGRVGPEKNFAERVLMAREGTSYGTLLPPLGYWVDVKARYLGLKFKMNKETHFGWARFNVHFSFLGARDLEVKATLTGYAYETIPQKPIVAGDEGAGASLGRLALGVAGSK